MAIDLFCYTSLNVTDTKDIIDVIFQDHPEIFPSKYFISDVEIAHEISKEIANDYGFPNACSTFLVSLNDKTLSVSTSSIADIFRHYMGNDNIIILHENETLI